MTTNNPPARHSSDLIQTLTDAAGRLVRQELREGQQELKGKALQSVPGVVMLVGAGVLGAAATGTATVLVLRVLERVVSPTAAAALATAALGGGAAVLGATGLKEIRKVDPMPEQTLRSIRADVEAATRTSDA